MPTPERLNDDTDAHLVVTIGHLLEDVRHVILDTGGLWEIEVLPDQVEEPPEVGQRVHSGVMEGFLGFPLRKSRIFFPDLRVQRLVLGHKG